MKKQFLFSLAGIVFVMCFLFSCSKNSGGGVQANGNVMLINASPGDSVAHDFYFNDAKINTQPISYPSNSGYLSLSPKGYTVKVAAVNSITTLASGDFNVGSGSYYSVFAYDTLFSGKIKVFATQDDLSAPASGKAKVRFLHLSPVSLAVDILANDSVLFSNRSYADNVSDNSKAAFTTVAAGTYTIKLRLAGAGDGILPLITLNNISFADGKIYTVFAKGTVSGSGVNALGAEIIVNK